MSAAESPRVDRGQRVMVGAWFAVAIVTKEQDVLIIPNQAETGIRKPSQQRSFHSRSFPELSAQQKSEFRQFPAGLSIHRPADTEVRSAAHFEQSRGFAQYAARLPPNTRRNRNSFAKGRSSTAGHCIWYDMADRDQISPEDDRRGHRSESDYGSLSQGAPAAGQSALHLYRLRSQSPRDESEGQGLRIAAVLVRRFAPQQREVK
jgi:hypothetical protein